MAHRIRYTMTQEPLSSKLDGIIEIDETWIGGKLRKAARRKKRRRTCATRRANKAAVVAVLQRGGRVQSMHVQRVTAENLKPIVEQMISEDAHVMTDSATTLVGVLKGRKHDQVNHFTNEYARLRERRVHQHQQRRGILWHLEARHRWGISPCRPAALAPLLDGIRLQVQLAQRDGFMRTVHALKSTTGKRLMLRDSSQPN